VGNRGRGEESWESKGASFSSGDAAPRSYPGSTGSLEEHTPKKAAVIRTPKKAAPLRASALGGGGSPTPDRKTVVKAIPVEWEDDEDGWGDGDDW